MAAPRPIRQLLFRHFLRGLFHNDLLSPDEDLHRGLAMLLGGVITAVVLGVTILMLKYSVPGLLERKLAEATNDRAFFTNAAMVLMALVTTLVWDALVLDRRDQAILGPLPVPARTVVLAKLQAVAALVAGLAVALSVVPSVLLPLIVLMEVEAESGLGIRMIAAQLGSSLGACAFGFLAVVAVRTLAAALAGRAARAVLAPAQFLLVLGLLTTLLLLPWLSEGTRGAVEGTSRALNWWPPAWFAGLYDVFAGRATPAAERLAATAASALAAVAVVSTITYPAVAARVRWSPADLASVGTRRSGPVWWLLRFIARRAVPRGVARASFTFTAHVLGRSPRHRLHVAAGLGVGLAVVGVSTALVASEIGMPAVRVPLPATMAAQLTLVFLATLGARIATRVPAQLQANWVFRLTAGHSPHPYLVGARRAVFVAVALPLIAALTPVHFGLWGARVGALQLAGGVGLSALLVYALFLREPRPPCVSPGAPGHGVGVQLPVCLVAYWLFVGPPVVLLHYSLREARSLVVLVSMAAALLAALWGAQWWWLRGNPAAEFDSDSGDATQALGLAD